MTLKHANLIGLALCIAAIAVTACMYPHLPDSMITRWSDSGIPETYSPKPFAASIGPLVMLVLWVALAALPSTAPKGFRIDEFPGAYAAVQLSLLGTMFVINLVMLLAGEGEPIHIERLLPMIISLLLVVMGNYMGKLRKNFFMGFRTPWTLASDEVWGRTHRLGGWLFVAAGVASAVWCALGGSLWFFGGAVLIAVFVPMVYSFFLYRRLEGFGR